MDLVEAAQKLAAIGAGLNRQTEAANHLAGAVAQQRESLVMMAQEAQEISEYIPEVLAAAEAFGLTNNIEPLGAAIEKVQEVVGFIVAALTEQEEADRYLQQLGQSTVGGEGAIEDALTLLNGVTEP